MTPEIIAIVTVGVALAGVILTSARGVRQDINELRGEVNDLRDEQLLNGNGYRVLPNR